MEAEALKYAMEDRDFYLALVKAKDLIDLFQIDVWSRANPRAYQRKLKESRSKKYKDYLKTHRGVFAQTILANCRDRNGLKYRESSGHFGVLTISSELYIVDGQHRLNGIKMLLEEIPSKGNLLVPVIIMNELNTENEAKEFLIINKTQKGIRADLSDRLLSDVIQNMDEGLLTIIGVTVSKSDIEKAVKVTDTLNRNAESLWRKKIQMPNETPTQEHIAKQRSFTAYLKPILQDNFIKTNYNTTAKLVKLLIMYWEAIAELCPGATGEERKEYVLMKTAGLYVMHKLFPQVLIKCGDNPTKAKMKTLLGKISEMNDDDWHVDGEIGDAGSGHHAFDRIYRSFESQLQV